MRGRRPIHTLIGTQMIVATAISTITRSKVNEVSSKRSKGRPTSIPCRIAGDAPKTPGGEGDDDDDPAYVDQARGRRRGRRTLRPSRGKPISHRLTERSAAILAESPRGSNRCAAGY